jgi:hypothetical protein
MTNQGKSKRNLRDLHTVDEAARTLRVPAETVRLFVKKFGAAGRRSGKPLVRPSEMQDWLADIASSRRIFDEVMNAPDDD